MSYMQFTVAMSDWIGDHPVESEKLKKQLSDHADFLKAVEKIIFDQWIQEDRLDGLIGFLKSNYDTSEGGEDLIYQLGQCLHKKQDLKRLKQLYKGFISYRVRYYWNLKNRCQILDRESERRRVIFELMNAYETFLVSFNHENELAWVQLERTLLERYEKRPCPKNSDKRKMDEPIFWEVIHTAKRSAETTEEYFIDLLQNQLEAMTPHAIKRFQKLLLQKMADLYQWELWAIAYLVPNCIN